jgi:hypothetical protein
MFTQSWLVKMALFPKSLAIFWAEFPHVSPIIRDHRTGLLGKYGASGGSRGARLASPGSFSRGSIAVLSWFDRSACTVKLRLFMVKSSFLMVLGQPDFEKHPSVSNTGTVQNVQR